jgi:hypothetical protein
MYSMIFVPCMDVGDIYICILVPCIKAIENIYVVYEVFFLIVKKVQIHMIPSHLKRMRPNALCVSP